MKDGAAQSLNLLIAMTLSFLAGAVVTWFIHTTVLKMFAYRETEDIQQAIHEKNQHGTWDNLDHDVLSNKLLLSDSNGDKVVLINSYYQLRLKEGRSAAIIQLIGSPDSDALD